MNPPTKKQKLKPNLNEYEQDLENNLLEKGKPLSADELAQEIHRLKTAAAKHIEKRKKEKRISIRVFSEDLQRLKEIAEEEGIPYQTLVTSVLHKFTTGRLIARGERH